MKFTDRKKILCIVVFVVSLGFYVYTLAPGVIWGDSAKLAIYVKKMYLPSDLVGGHPLHTLLGKLFATLPFKNFAYSQNFMSAFFASLTTSLIYLIVRRLTGSDISALAASLSLAVSHTFWHSAVINETYALVAFFLSLMLWLFLIWSETQKKYLLFLLAFLWSLSLLNSTISFFYFAGFIYFFIFSSEKKYRQLKLLSETFIFLLLPLLLYLLTLLYILPNSKNLHLFSVLSIAKIISLQTKWYVNPSVFLPSLFKYFLLLMYQFPVLGIIIGFIGLWKQFHLQKKYFIFLLLLIIGVLSFSLGYIKQRQFYLFLPTYVVFSIWIGIGFWELQRGLNLKRIVKFKAICFPLLLIVPPVLYYNIPMEAEKFNLNLTGARTVPYRNNNSFYLLPDKRQTKGPFIFAQEVFGLVEPNSLLLGDFTIRKVLEYFQIVEGKRKDIRIESIDRYFYDKNSSESIIKLIDANIDSRSIYLLDNEDYYHIDKIEKKYNVVKINSIYKVVKK